MVRIAKNLDIREIETRAAQIRSHWSPAERLRRTGLPPDVPPRLRDFIMGRESGWSTSRSAKEQGR